MEQSPDSSDRLEESRAIGPFRIIATLGQGGMGTVYLAEQVEPIRRRVALKMIRSGREWDQTINRFRAEGQALALMDHPNVAKVYEVGDLENGVFYLAMELVETETAEGDAVPGIPLTRYCDRKKLNLSERLELFSQVCRAVHHAHLKGVIHRDIKPSNLLVGEADGKAVPKVIDFGIAKDVGAKLVGESLYTETGQLIGTPQYMSPEQASGVVGAVDVRTDVYALGAVLYELLCGEAPIAKETFRSASLEEVLRIIREEEPMKPSARAVAPTDGGSTSEMATERGHRSVKQLAKSLSGDLDWIVSKALEKDPQLRHQSAEQLAEDVDAFVSGRPLPHSGAPSRVYRLKKFVQRNRTLVRTAALIALLLIGGGLGTALLRDAQIGENYAEGLYRSTYATLMFSKGDQERGLEYLRKNLAETSNPNIRFDTQERLADELVKRGEYADASQIYLQMIDDMSGPRSRRIGGLNSSLILIFANRLEAVLKKMGNEEELNPAIQKILPTFEKEERRRITKRGEISATLIPQGATWRWFDASQTASDSPIHRTFLRSDFDDSNWWEDSGVSSGEGWQGGDGERAERSEGGDGHSRLGWEGPIYFRHQFQVSHPIDNLELRLQCHDGIVVFLDGVEVARDNVSPSQSASDLSAASEVTGLGRFITRCFPVPGDLSIGEHTLAISLLGSGGTDPESSLRLAQVSLVAIEASADD